MRMWLWVEKRLNRIYLYHFPKQVKTIILISSLLFTYNIVMKFCNLVIFHHTALWCGSVSSYLVSSSNNNRLRSRTNGWKAKQSGIRSQYIYQLLRLLSQTSASILVGFLSQFYGLYPMCYHTQCLYSSLSNPVPVPGHLFEC